MKRFSIIFILITIQVSAQQGAIPFLLTSVSPVQNSMGQTGTSLPTDDPYGFLLNPAQLGYTSQSNNLSVMFSPGVTNLYGWDDLELSGFALNLGYNFKHLIGFPLSIGFGYANPELNYGIFISDGPYGPISFESKDYYKAYSLGAGIDYGVQFFAGITFKDITSKISRYTVDVTAMDYGFLLNVPVLRLLDDKFTLNLIRKVPDKTYLNFSVGLATSNIGDEIYYIDPAQADPLPRSVRFGYGISGGLDLYFERTPLNILDIAFTAEARDELIDRNVLLTPGLSFPIGVNYQSGLGDIKIGKNILQIEGDENVRAMTGLQLSFLETLIIRRGHTAMYTNVDKTSGIEVRLKGMLKLLEKYSDSPVVEFISNHFDLRYITASHKLGGTIESKFEGIALVVNGFEFR